MESLSVFFGQTLVGILSLNKDRSFMFQYDKNWIKSQDGFQLSISLPMQEGPITGGHVRFFFANLLPESAVRSRVARSLGVSEKNDFMLLKELGGDCAGAISLLQNHHKPETPDLYGYLPISDSQADPCPPHELKYQAEGGPGLSACFSMVRNYSANPVKDIQLLLKWVFFNFLIGNMNGHAKNLSFLYHKRQICLAPFYDLIATEIYESLTRKLAMKIGNENRPDWIMERHWERMASDIKLSLKVVKKHLASFCVQLADTLDSTLTAFTWEYGENGLVRKISAATGKRAARTLEQLTH
ncbi:HipA N-terminal domain-containing protein [Desulfobacterales bacterium HSG16]|nr:HipA N-terminal domain-containing protein [Desulfobacterales bacterium HSG16]